MYRYDCYFTLQGTSDLSLRIGLNSGPTTAGVLRGEKARFQLFGDVRIQSCCIVIPTFKVFFGHLFSYETSIACVCIDCEHGI
jgi:hypothetical protein